MCLNISVHYNYIIKLIVTSVPDDYPLVLGCGEHVSSLRVFVA